MGLHLPPDKLIPNIVSICIYRLNGKYISIIFYFIYSMIQEKWNHLLFGLIICLRYMKHQGRMIKILSIKHFFFMEFWIHICRIVQFVVTCNWFLEVEIYSKMCQFSDLTRLKKNVRVFRMKMTYAAISNQGHWCWHDLSRISILKVKILNDTMKIK